MPVSLFLKFPATILQISPKASKASSVVSSGSMPNIREAIRFAAFDEHRKIQTPRSLPARPTIAVNSEVVTWVPGGATVASLFSMAEKTSHVASCNNFGQFSRPWVYSLCAGRPVLSKDGVGRWPPSGGCSENFMVVSKVIGAN